MKEQKEPIVSPGSEPAPETFYITITANGPYLVYGNPPIDQEIIVPNKEGSWEYRKGKSFDNSRSPVALCRCGTSKNHPFCDGNHVHAHWNPTLTDSNRPILEGAVAYEGPTQVLADNEKYCAFARFCDPYGQVWNLVERSVTEDEKKLVEHESGHCPAGRLILVNRESREVFEPKHDPSIGIIEDPAIKVSGPLWVKGGIRIENEDGMSYEIRNRVTLCRCGMSSNKPFCNGAHASIKFKDGLPIEEEKEYAETEKASNQNIY